MGMYAIDGGRGETLTEAVGRRFREQLAGKKITRREVAQRLQKSEPWVGRRAAGQTPFTTDDLEAIERVTGISSTYLITGVNAESRRPTMSDGGWQYTPRDSNPEPTDLSSAPHHDAADIIALPSACDPAAAPERDQPADVVDLATARPGATITGEVTA